MFLSIVIPCFNEQEVLFETYRRIKSVTSKFHPLETEIIFVDDGSKDNTPSILRDIALKNKNIKIIKLARNFGHQIASTAGIDSSIGDAVVLIDADLQDPPEIIPEMIKKWQEGYDVVYGTRIERKGETLFKKFTARYFYKILNKISEVQIPLDTGDFRLMSKKVVNALKVMPERDRFIRGMVSWIGFKQISLPYRRETRFAGSSKYPLRKMLSFSIDGLVSFSAKPLDFSILFGIFSALMAVLGIFYAIVLRVFTNIWVEGWTALMIAVLFIGGVQLLCLGIVGKYIGRIYREIKGRPLYFVEEYIGFEEVPPIGSRSLQ